MKMKKTLLALTVISALMVLTIPLLSSAQVSGCVMRQSGIQFEGYTACPGAGASCDFNTTDPPCGMCCLVNTVYIVTNWIFVFLMALVILLIIVGAFFILTAGGEAEKVNKGRGWIMWAIVGLIIALIAKATPSIVKMIISAS